MDDKTYAVAITKEAADLLLPLARRFLHQSGASFYFNAKKIEPNEQNYFRMWLEDKLPDGKMGEFELRIHHRFICAVVYAADAANVKNFFGFTPESNPDGQ